MPSVNKQSLRNEFDQLKVRFEELSDEGKVTPESLGLFQAMFMLFELLIAFGKGRSCTIYKQPSRT